MPIIKVILVINTFCLFSFAYADIYSWVDENGNRVYTDKKPTSDKNNQQQSLPATGSVNYYNPALQQKPTVSAPAKKTAISINNTNTRDQENTGEKPLTEQECQQRYQKSCERVVNWRKYALEHCADDERCQDEDYLDGKYRPRTIEELQAIARKASARNMRDKNIAMFLRKEYTQYCDNQAALYCKNKRDRQCKKTMASFCSDSRDLKDIFKQYNNLTLVEKQQIIQKAKQLSVASGKNQKAYQKILGDIIELLIMQAALGI